MAADCSGHLRTKINNPIRFHKFIETHKESEPFSEPPITVNKEVKSELCLYHRESRCRRVKPPFSLVKERPVLQRGTDSGALNPHRTRERVLSGACVQPCLPHKPLHAGQEKLTRQLASQTGSIFLDCKNANGQAFISPPHPTR